MCLIASLANRAGCVPEEHDMRNRELREQRPMSTLSKSHVASAFTEYQRTPIDMFINITQRKKDAPKWKSGSWKMVSDANTGHPQQMWIV
jgi:hypothetical protein